MLRAGGAAHPLAPLPLLMPSLLPALIARRLLASLAALALLASGSATALPRSVMAVASVAASSVVAPPADRSAMSAPDRALLVRGAPLAGVPGPTGSGSALPPGSSPLVAPHLVDRSLSRPPTAELAGTPVGAPGSRAPPAAAGT